MTDTDWKELREAYDVLKASPSLTRMDSAFWVMYKIGMSIRIDIKGV